MSDSWMPRKLEAQFDGRYLMSSVLITSTMKSDPATPLMRDCAAAAGISISTAATCALGGTAEGARGTSGARAARAAGASAPAALAATAPVRNFRRAGFNRESLLAIVTSVSLGIVAERPGKSYPL